MKKIKAGLLPLYIKLYDDCSPGMRPGIDAFHRLISDKLKENGLDIIDVPVCRIKEEFTSAVKKFETEGADAIITLHLAYSPSLESTQALISSPLPIIVLDTTPDYIYDTSTEGEALSYNHGIHGVQDLCNMLRRGGKHYEIFAGHWQRSDVIERAVYACRAAAMTGAMKRAKVGIVGRPFEGMGDFAIPFPVLKNTIGMEVVPCPSVDFASVSDEEIDAEYASDSEAFACDEMPEPLYSETARVGLGVRRWIKENSLTAFTMNFLSSGAIPGFSKMPFCEASKAMAAGIGYAGEGDVLTAAFVGALLTVYEKATFAEMFCPDWSGGSVFLSHMGEFNLKCAAGVPKLKIKPFKYTRAGDTTAIIASLAGGRALFTCLAPQKDDGYSLIIARGEMLDVSGSEVNLQSGDINGWFKPDMPLPRFLERYSLLGGIHHAAVVYGGDEELLSVFGRYMGWDVNVI